MAGKYKRNERRFLRDGKLGCNKRDNNILSGAKKMGYPYQTFRCSITDVTYGATTRDDDLYETKIVKLGKKRKIKIKPKPLQVFPYITGEFFDLNSDNMYNPY